jgi:hypothetical protein
VGAAVVVVDGAAAAVVAQEAQATVPVVAQEGLVGLVGQGQGQEQGLGQEEQRWGRESGRHSCGTSAEWIRI